MQTCGLRVTVSKVEELATLAQPGASQPALVILDMRDRPTLPPTVAMLRRQHPTTGVVIVAASLEPALMLDAMRAGVTEFLTAPVTAPDLSAAITRVTTATAPTASGEVFAFLGAKGGVGTTTVATNVATALAQLADGSTILIDLHLAYGDAAVYLGTEPRFSVIDALENVHRLDKAFLGGLVGHARGGLSLLASSDRASATPVDSTSVRTLIESAARHYRYVVLDVPRSDVMIDALEPSSRIVIVANQELATVRAATRLSAALRQRYGKDRLSVVVSRYRRPVGDRTGRRRTRARHASRAHVSEQLPHRARGAEYRPSGRPGQPQQARGGADRFRARPGRDERGTPAGQTASWTVWSSDRSTIVDVGTLSGVKMRLCKER